MAHVSPSQTQRPLPVGLLILGIVAGVLLMAFGPLAIQVVGAGLIVGSFAWPAVRLFASPELTPTRDLRDEPPQAADNAPPEQHRSPGITR